MSHYKKTELGLEVLKNRSLPLNARQRRLLLLIGTEDFDLLNDRLKQQLASQTLLDELLELGLIEALFERTQPTPIEDIQENLDHTFAQHSPSVLDLTQSEISTGLTQPSSSSVTFPQQTQQAATPEPAFMKLYFEDIQQLMIDTLQRYCGLMAKIHIQKIARAQNIDQLKQCQMQWITALQESRIPPTALNQLLKQINYSLAALMQPTTPSPSLSLKSNESIELDN